MLIVKKFLYKVASFLGGDGSWKSLTSECRYFKKSGIVTVTYYSASKNITTSYQVVATLPVGYRPASDMYFSVMTVSAIDQVVGVIQANGNISLRTASGSTTYSGFTVSFPTVES